jgi:hypothetical protein
MYTTQHQNIQIFLTPEWRGDMVLPLYIKIVTLDRFSGCCGWMWTTHLPKACVLKDWSPVGCNIASWGTIISSLFYGELEPDWRKQSLFPSLFPPSHCQVSSPALFPTMIILSHSPALFPTMIILSHLRPKAMEPVDHGLKPLKLWAKINLSSVKLFHSGICHTY